MDRLTEEQRRRYFTTNEPAHEAFLERQVNGLGLSEQVWEYADSFRREMEMGIDLGIRSGEDAATMARSLRQYLRNPDKLFRRVRDEHGQLHLSRAAADYHPGRGVYRSSYKNARRLAVTETNMAYHTADYLRWQEMDFVVGIEIRMSGNHTCLGSDGKPHVFVDICDELKGKYPKDFKFVGWHPHCRCQAIPILKTEEEMMADSRQMLDGGKPSGESVNDVEKPPKAFNDWVRDNKDRIEDAESGKRGSLPYFIRDNRSAVDNALGRKQQGSSVAGAIEKVKEKTLDQIQHITTHREKSAYVAFEPFSPVLKEYLDKRRDKKDKLRLFDELLNDDVFECIHVSENGRKTVNHPSHKDKNDSWKNTKKMAYALNDSGRDVIFLPEHDNLTNADALTIVKGFPRIVDFKYSSSTKWNTLQQHLAEGFSQAGAVVLKLENMDAGQFKETIGYMKRNGLPLGDMLLINKYGKVLEIQKDDFNSNKYTKKIRGHLK